MRKNTAIITIAATLFAAPGVYFAVRWATPIAAWIGFGMKTELQNYADFKLAGVVVNEDGSPVGEVAVWITAGRRKKMGFETDNKTWREKSDGTFDIKVDNANSVTLKFLKVGYEPERLQFSGGATSRGLRVVMRRARKTEHH